MILFWIEADVNNFQEKRGKIGKKRILEECTI